MFTRLFSALMMTACPMLATAQQSDVSHVTFLEGWRMENGRHMGAVQISLAPGWKTYWRAPGANGIPPEFDWTGSENIASARILWPRPEVFESYGTTTIGYQNSVVMPIEITPKTPGQPINVNLGLFYGVCEDVCIPAQAQMTGVLSTGTGLGHDAINAALSLLPETARNGGVTSVTCVIRPSEHGLSVSAEVRFSSEIGGTPLVVFETPSDQMWFTQATTEVVGKSLHAQATLETYAKDGVIAVDRDAIRLTLLGHDRAIDISGCPAG